MAPRSFVYLAVATVASVVLAAFAFIAGNQWRAVTVGGERLMPVLENAIGQVAEVTIRQGENKVVLERKGGSWALKSRDGYPVDIAKVRTLLVALSQAELIEPKTRKPDMYALLELEDPAAKDAKSRHVILTDAKGNPIAEAVLGKTRSDGFGVGKVSGTYVRRPGNPQTWLANVEISAPLAVKDWAKTAVLALDATKIDRVTVEIPGEQPLKIERAPAAPKESKDAEAKGKEAKADAKTDTKGAKADGKGDAGKETAEETAKDTKVEPGKLAFVGLPGDGKKLKDAYAAEALTRAVASIDLEDVRKVTAPPPTEGASVVKLERADGLAATYTLRKDGDAHWLSIAVAGEGDAKKAADEIAARTKDWEFKLPASKVEQILKKRSDLVEAADAKG